MIAASGSAHGGGGEASDEDWGAGGPGFGAGESGGVPFFPSTGHILAEETRTVLTSFKKWSCCFLVAQSCPTLCDPMDHSTPGFRVHHQLPEFTQTHVHRVGDAIQPSHPLSSPSPLAFNLSQHQDLLQ